MQEPILTKREHFALELAKHSKWYDGTFQYQVGKIVDFADALLKKLDDTENSEDLD